ncbi:MAG: DUF3800 domain-containing protein [Syntrophaceae bacterium]|nr:DUF3800 domain-containing protein [Syntrophaceae bacterium]
MIKYDIFIDESCHLMDDYSKSVMAIGYIKVPRDDYHRIKLELNDIKLRHKTPMEIKWGKISESRLSLYIALIDYFFMNPIEFRCILVKYKERLDHDQFNQGSHDNFYYKLIYHLLNNPFVNPIGNQYRTFLDIKDTRGRDKIRKINEIFENKFYGKSPFIHFQHIRSEESVLLQLADLFIGAVTYKTRVLHESSIKNKIIEYLEEKSGYVLDESTEPWETKFNIFDHQPKKK